ncbi:MAG: hypothetical protein JRG91_19045 [Deltaproteobacteria bacterium]|nr:hypothetical protein [Deltaproteobacteria bacterium]
MLSLAVAAGCGGKNGTEGDTDTAQDTPDDTATDLATDAPADAPPDAVDDPVEDAADDPVEDTVEDTAEDAAGDPAEDAPPDPVDDEATDATDEDASSDVTVESTCGSSPYIRTSDKGTVFSSGACNPDGSTTEAVVAADMGGCCISVDHYCAWMNCCSYLTPTLGITSMPRAVRITETETGAFCDCEGWFSPSYEICGLSPGTWTVRIGGIFISVTVS